MNFRPFLAAAFLFLCAVTLASAADSYSFSRGAQGFLIREYNEKLLACVRATAKDRAQTPKEPNAFDTATEENTRILQAGIETGARSPAGRAGPAEFTAVGLPWPDDFTRCVNLIDCWEGTFAKLEGSSESEDTFPNVTFGIVGFTSEDGSLQEFLQAANEASKGAVFQMARDRLSAADAEKFIDLVEHYRSGDLKRNHDAFVKLIIRNPKADPEDQQPRPEMSHLFTAFDNIPQFRDIQLSAARKKSWDQELPDYRELMFGSSKSRSLQTDLFLFDMTVLTDGPGKKAWQKLAKMSWHSEGERMNQVFAAMKSSSEYKEDEDKRADILERERCIIEGHGEVHDDDYDLRAFALAPAP